MTLEEMRREVAGDKYDFLREDAHLGENICLLVPGGSHAYGTNIEGSDFDVRGATLESAAEVLGFEDFGEVEEREETDTVIYGFRKLVKLLAACNPNVIEILGTREVIYANDLGRELLAHRHIFLSQRAYLTFSGYATAQLRRLENAIAHDTADEAARQRHIKGTLEIQLMQFEDMFAAYDDDNKVHLSMSEDNEILVETELKNVPLPVYMRLISDMKNTVKNYAKLTGRSNKKDEAHLFKHAMHLIRLYLMGIDILREEEIVTYRAKERPMLLDIRNGRMTMGEVFALQRELARELEDVKKHTRLPMKPDAQEIERFLVDAYEKYLFNHFKAEAMPMT